MDAIDRYSTAALRRLYRDIMAKGDPFADAPLATDWRQRYVDQCAVNGTLQAALGRHARRWRRALWFMWAQGVVIAGLVAWRVWG